MFPAWIKITLLPILNGKTNIPTKNNFSHHKTQLSPDGLFSQKITSFSMRGICLKLQFSLNHLSNAYLFAYIKSDLEDKKTKPNSVVYY